MGQIEKEFVIKENKKKNNASLCICLFLLICLILVIAKDFGLIEKMGLEVYVNRRETLFIKGVMVLLLFAIVYFFLSYLILVMNKDGIMAVDETGFTYRFSPYEKIFWKDVLEINEVSKHRRKVSVALKNFDYYLEQLPPISKNFLKRNGKSEDQQIICARIFTTDYSTKELVSILNQYWDKYKAENP